jgi:hypothetical protein
MAAVPDFPGQGRQREGLVLRLGSKGLIDSIEQHWSAGIVAGAFVYV